MTEGAHERRGELDARVTRELAPGGPRAKAGGCLCSVLANAAFRAGQAEVPAVDPRCPMHATAG